MSNFQKEDEFLFAKCSRSGDPRKGYWLDWVTVLLAVFILVSTFTGRLSKPVLRALFIAAEVWLLLPMLDIMPHAFGTEFVRRQTEQENQRWRVAALDRVLGFFGGLFWALFLF